MTPHIPAVTAQQLVSVALALEFSFHRQQGSHAIYSRKGDNARRVIPMHVGVTIKPKTLAGIVQDMGITMDELRSKLKMF